MNLREAYREYKKGYNLRELSRKFDIPRETLRIKFKKNGMGLRKSRKEIAITYHKPKLTVNSDSAELVAMHAGDGSLCVDGRWCFTSFYNDLKLINRVCELSKNILGVEPRVYKYGNRVQIVSGQKQVFDYFSRIFPVGKKSHIVRLPGKFYRITDRRILASLLIGLFSTDGCFSLRKNGSARVEFRVRSKFLRNQFLTLSAKVGFKFKKSNPMSNGKLIYTAYIEKRKEVKKWMETIGSRCDTHNKRYERWVNAGVP